MQFINRSNHKTQNANEIIEIQQIVDAIQERRSLKVQSNKTSKQELSHKTQNASIREKKFKDK
jgi:hypothetical protein